LIDHAVATKMRSAQYALREAARDLRFCVQLHIGPHTVKAH
jgi:hypothetical protein